MIAVVLVEYRLLQQLKGCMFLHGDKLVLTYLETSKFVLLALQHPCVYHEQVLCLLCLSFLEE